MQGALVWTIMCSERRGEMSEVGDKRLAQRNVDRYPVLTWIASGNAASVCSPKALSFRSRPVSSELAAASARPPVLAEYLQFHLELSLLAIAAPLSDELVSDHV